MNKKQKDFSSVYLERLKSEINDLAERLSQKEKKENEYLREKIKRLEFENLRLNNILYGSKNGSLLFFHKKDKNIIS